METLKKQMGEECLYKLPEPLLDELLALTTEVRVRPRRAMIPCGKFDDNAYIIKNGLIRLTYFDGIHERTHGFALPGTMLLSYHCYYMRQPSFFQYEACRKEVTALKLSKKDLDDFIDRHPEATKWALSLSIGQLYMNELKMAVINGDARARFEATIKNRPEIMAEVSMRVIASYLGITPAYLCRLRKTLI